MQTSCLSYEEITGCCGCRACGQSCPVTAIQFVEDDEGFIYPSIDTSFCISCGLCKTVCPMLQPSFHEAPQNGYAAYINDSSLLSKSSSGGAFIALAKTVITDGGVVCGCANDGGGMPVHTVAKTDTELSLMQGSKYAQSNMGTIYTETEKHLKAGIEVLFTGTPCQVAGLKTYLRKPYSNLYCMDLICHGVPSRKIFQEYLNWLEKKENGKLVYYQFRSKKKNGWSYTRRVEILKRNNRVRVSEITANLDPYCFGFLRGFMCRQSCYKCPYSRMERAGDITVGDFWGINKTYPELFNQNGVSAVIVNTDHGRQLLQKAQGYLHIDSVEVAKIQEYNENLKTPTSKPELRDHIYKELNESGFDAVAGKYMRVPHYGVHFIKDKIPNKLRVKIKDVLKYLLKK